MRVCIAGKNRIAVDSLRFISKNYPSNEFLTIANRTDQGHDGSQPSFKKAAAQLGIELIELDALAKSHVDLFISLEFDRIIKAEHIEGCRAYNIHFSLLPRYRGVYTSAWPILNGESHSGVSLHEIDSGIDTGPIVDQARFALSANETAESLYEKYQTQGILLLQKNLPALLDGTAIGKPQGEGATYFSKASIDYSNLNIDCNVTAEELSRQLRAFYFPAFQVPTVKGFQLSNPRITDHQSVHPPGFIVERSATQVVIATKTFDLVCDLFPSAER
jgi:methionyl-tRNA formyltransferase